MNYMKKWMQKYRFVILLMALVASMPIAINFILLIPSFTPIVGDNVEWLSFWSSCISAAVAFVILHIERIDSKKQNEDTKRENKHENEKNRKLQINILKYQQEMQWLNMFRQASVEYVLAYTYNDLVFSINAMRDNPKYAFNLLGNLLERLAKCDTSLAYIGMRGENSKKLYDRCASLFILYNDVIYDIQHIMIYLIESNNPSFEAFCIDSSNNIEITSEMKDIISSMATQKGVTLEDRFNDVAMNRIKVIEKHAEKIRDIFSVYISEEQKRIDDILINNLT